jgi:hypothetical protein
LRDVIDGNLAMALVGRKIARKLHVESTALVDQ